MARQVSHWESAITCARQHRIVPLLYERLTKAGVALPGEIQDQLRVAYDRNAFHSLANAAELVRILRLLEGRGIPAMPFKGVVLASSVYGTLTIRPAGDLDLLIHAHHLGQASSALRESGYELKTKTRDDGSPAIEDYYEYHFERASDGMVLELRWRLELTQPRFHHDLGMDWVWPHRRSVKLAGVDVPDIDPERTLLVLCMHGGKHAWSRLIWVCDVAQFLERRQDLDWKALKKEARRVGLARALALGVILARRVCDADVPDDVLLGFESDRGARDLASYFEEALFDEPGRTPNGHMPYSLRLLDVRDRILAMLSPGVLRPNERDRQMIRLPRAFFPLYYLIRPIRILLDRSPR
ncbi:MAG: nucleotidyltransferase family protein [Terracidiphilus sp.]